jgi:hypothetical protein
MSVPPDLMALLQGGGDPSAAGGAPVDGPQDPAAGAPMDPSQGPPSDQPDPTSSVGPDPQAAVDYLKQMIDLAKKYLDVEPDEEDKATMTKVMSQLQQYLAKDQSELDGAMSGSLSPRAMRKAGSGAAS